MKYFAMEKCHLIGVDSQFWPSWRISPGISPRAEMYQILAFNKNWVWKNFANSVCLWNTKIRLNSVQQAVFINRMDHMLSGSRKTWQMTAYISTKMMKAHRIAQKLTYFLRSNFLGIQFLVKISFLNIRKNCKISWHRVSFIHLKVRKCHTILVWCANSKTSQE